jgi:hypothetical protein
MHRGAWNYRPYLTANGRELHDFYWPPPVFTAWPRANWPILPMELSGALMIKSGIYD